VITPDTKDFTKTIESFVDKAKGRTKAFAAEFIQDVNEAVVRGTPVDTGFLRGSWFAALNGDPSGDGAADKTGGSAIARLNLVASGITLGDVFVAQNGAAYAGFVHNGTSKMAPRPWVTAVLDRADSIAETAARRVAGE